MQVSNHMSSIERDRNGRNFSQVSIYFKQPPVSMITSIWYQYQPTLQARNARLIFPLNDEPNNLWCCKSLLSTLGEGAEESVLTNLTRIGRNLPTEGQLLQSRIFTITATTSRFSVFSSYPTSSMFLCKLDFVILTSIRFAIKRCH